jgi:hypothetical protein
VEDVDALRDSTKQVVFARDVPQIDPFVVASRDKAERRVIKVNGCQAGNSSFRKFSFKFVLLMWMER